MGPFSQGQQQIWVVWQAAVGRGSIVLLKHNCAILHGKISDQHDSPVLRVVCGGHVSIDCFKMKDTSLVGDTLKHPYNPTGSPQIVFSPFYPEGTSVLHLMKTLCGWTGPA